MKSNTGHQKILRINDTSCNGTTSLCQRKQNYVKINSKFRVKTTTKSLNNLCAVIHVLPLLVYTIKKRRDG